MVTIDFTDFTKKGLKSLLQKFDKAGLTVKDVTATNKSIRESGYPIKTAILTFESGQTLTLKVKGSGDLYQAKLNGKVLAIKEYHKAETFTDEVLAYVKSNEPAYAKQKEKQLSRVKIAVPKIKPVNTSIAEQVAAFSTSLEEFKGQNEAVKVQLDALTTPIAAKLNTLGTLKNQLDAENAKSAELQKQLDGLKSGIMESAGDDKKAILLKFIDFAGLKVVNGSKVVSKGTGEAKGDISEYAMYGKDTLLRNKMAVASATSKEMLAKILEAAGTAPVQIDRTRIAQDILHSVSSHPKLAQAFLEGYNNSCDINDAIAFIESFSDDELLNFLKAEENIFEGVELKAEGKIARLTKKEFLTGIKAPEETAILEAVEQFNAFQAANDKPARAMILECSECSGDSDDTLAGSGEMQAAHDGRGSYAINTEETGWGAFQDTTVLLPYVYPAPVIATLGAKGDCPRCGAEMVPCTDGDCPGGKECTACGCEVTAEGMVMESAPAIAIGTEVTLKGHRAEGDALAGKKALILESVPTVQGPFYKVQVDGLFYRGIAPGMILEGIGLEIDRSGYHDINDPAHIDDPDHENLGGNVKNCPWCGSDVSEQKCIACGRQYDIATTDRREWIAANKELPADDFPSQYE